MDKYRITIEYCVPWNYLPRAVRATEDILSNYQHIVESLELITGSGGAYEVKVNDELVYSKKQTKRHAEEGEILKIFEGIIGPDVEKYPK